MQNKSTINVSRRRRFPFKISQNCRISQYCPFPELMNDPWLGVSLLFLLVVLVLRSTFIKLYPKFRMFDYYYYRINTPITASTVRIEIGKTYGAEGIGQITFFVSTNILWSLKKCPYNHRKVKFWNIKKIIFKIQFT